MNNNTSETNAMDNASGVASGVNSNEIFNADSGINIDRGAGKWVYIGCLYIEKALLKDYNENETGSSSDMNINAAHLPDLSERPKENSEVNTHSDKPDNSDYLEVSENKTSRGLPTAPKSAKLVRVLEGLCLSWELPEKCDPSDIIEYSVYLAIKTKPQNDNPTIQPSQMSFIRIYVGPDTKFVVSFNTLADADKNCSTNPAIVFRIAARNSNGYGPTLQVRWLQEPTNDDAASTSTHLNTTKPKDLVKTYFKR